MISDPIVLILGSAPGVLACRDWPRAPFDQIVAINNAWAVRPDWDVLIHPEDFARDRMPGKISARQTVVKAGDYVPAQNRYGGFVFAGGTMAFTAAYWALDALRPRVLAFLGCDMVYAATGKTHFYGTGSADPLREDVTLRDLGAKSARLAMMAAAQGCQCVNLSDAAQTALLFPKAAVADLGRVQGVAVDRPSYDALRQAETALGYDTPDGRYWKREDQYDPAMLADIDARWRRLYAAACAKR